MIVGCHHTVHTSAAGHLVVHADIGKLGDEVRLRPVILQQNQYTP